MVDSLRREEKGMEGGSGQGRSQDLVSGGGHPFRGGARPPIFRLRPQITRVPPYVLLATPGFRGGAGPPRPPWLRPWFGSMHSPHGSSVHDYLTPDNLAERVQCGCARVVVPLAVLFEHDTLLVRFVQSGRRHHRTVAAVSHRPTRPVHPYVVLSLDKAECVESFKGSGIGAIEKRAGILIDLSGKEEEG